MSLTDYQKKRKFAKTPEPPGKRLKKANKPLSFVIHQHFATRIHFDLRLEMEGVLKSWAVPKGPSDNPSDKRLAVQVEDHPLEYGKFQGIIPEGNYGAGRVLIWDKGTYTAKEAGKDRKSTEKILKAALMKGHLNLLFQGEKLRGEYDLVRMSGQPKNWLLIKKKAQNQNELTREISTLNPREIPKPMLAKTAKSPFNKKGWLFEIKWDGYRAIAVIDKSQINLYSRNMISFNDRFPSIVKELSKLKNQMVLDGEVVVVDREGKADFQLIQDYRNSNTGQLVYYVFDILEYKNKDLRDLPLSKRKALLRQAKIESSHVKICEFIEDEGKEFFELAVKNGLEGIMAKKSDSPYQENIRSDNWLKIKHVNKQEAVIAGITEPKGGRKEFGALVLGLYENDKLIYIGHTGGGFDEKSLELTKHRLEPLFTSQCPFERAPKTNTPVQWVKPELVCEVKFANWTKDGYMRAPVFLGIREDKRAGEVKREIPVQNSHESSQEIPRKNYSNPQKILWPKEKFTKKDLIEYYEKISRYILPYIKDRPEILNRFPNGINQPNFYQKNLETVPPGIKTVPIFSQSENKYINYLFCQDLETLLYMANLACIEIHPWNSRYPALDRPDYLILDLDPLDVPFEKVVETAKAAKKVFDRIGVASYCKTSGATGLHVYVPMGAKYNTEQVLNFAKLLAELVHQELPEITSMERMPEQRAKKVYLDYLQNRQGQSIVAPYSLRPRPFAPVSTPLEWSEVKKGLNPEDFNLKTIWKRLKKKGDLWKKVLGPGINMEKALKLIEKQRIIY